DYIFAAIEFVRAAARLHHRQAAPQRALDLHQTEQNDIVHNRAHREIRHKSGETEKLRILITEEGSHQPMLAVRHQGMKEIAIDSLVLQRGAITRHAVDDHTLDIVLLDGLDDLCEMDIDI